MQKHSEAANLRMQDDQSTEPSKIMPSSGQTLCTQLSYVVKGNQNKLEVWRKEEFMSHGLQMPALCQWHIYQGRRRRGVAMVAHPEDWYSLPILCPMAGIQPSNWPLNPSALPGSGLAMIGSHHEMLVDGMVAPLGHSYSER